MHSKNTRDEIHRCFVGWVSTCDPDTSYSVDHGKLSLYIFMAAEAPFCGILRAHCNRKLLVSTSDRVEGQPTPKMLPEPRRIKETTIPDTSRGWNSTNEPMHHWPKGIICSQKWGHSTLVMIGIGHVLLLVATVPVFQKIP